MTAAASTTLLVDHPADGVLRLCLNRPEQRNALDRPLVSALADAFASIDGRAVVLASADARVFCSGADLSLADDDRREVSDRLHDLYERMLETPAPIVAALAGPAVGGGAQLAVAADLRVAGPRASLRFPGAGHGLSVAAWALPSLVGRGRALDLCLTMREVNADEALAIGLVDRVVPDPDAAAVALAAELAQLDADAVARVKRVVARASGVLEPLRLEREENRRWSGSVAALRRIVSGGRDPS